MTWLRILLHRLRGLFLRRKLEQELEDEIRSHLDLQIADYQRQGMSLEEARRAARRSFGGVEQMKEAYRDKSRLRWVEDMWQDLRYAVRMLLKQPVFTLAAVLTLSLGIGANTAIFTIINAVLLRPLPFDDPGRLVVVWQTNPQRDSFQGLVSPPDLGDWQRQCRSLEQLAAFMPRGVSLTGVADPEHLPGSHVSANLFPLLGVEPLLGRNFRPAEDGPQGDRVVIVSYGFWQRRFGGALDLIGKTLTLNGAAHTVVGVMPPAFQFPIQGQFPIPPSELWLPLGLDPGRVSRESRDLFTVGRLKPTTTLPQAQAELAAIARQLEQQYPQSNAGFGVSVVGLHEQIVKGLRPALLVLLGAVAFLLLIACANVANLLLARAAARRKEIALRAALGAGRRRLLRQLLTESLLLALLGGACGLALAVWTVDVLAGALPATMARAGEVSVDRQVFGFTLIVSLLTGLIFGLAPAWQAARLDLNEALKEGGGQGPGGAGPMRLRRLLVVGEVALALVLLVGAGLLIRSFHRLQQVSPGFNPERVVAVPFVLPPAQYREGNARAAFVEQVLQRVKALPGVQSAGVVTTLPFSGDISTGTFTVEGRPPAAGESDVANRRGATPDYFRAMGIPLVKGRAFTAHDTVDAPAVVIINETMARRYFPGVDPLGKRIVSPAGPGGVVMTVVGVVGDVKNAGLDEEPKPEFYYCYFQNRLRFMVLAVRTATEPQALIAALRREVWAVDKDLPLANIATLEQLLGKTVAQRRLTMLLLGAFAAVALALAALGVYGLLSYGVAQRQHEIGIRLALGARAADVIGLIVWEGMALALLGLALGLAAALGLTRLMASLLFGVTPGDPATFAAVALLLTLVALLACFLPARRAAKVDPMVALRYE